MEWDWSSQHILIGYLFIYFFLFICIYLEDWIPHIQCSQIKWSQNRVRSIWPHKRTTVSRSFHSKHHIHQQCHRCFKFSKLGLPSHHPHTTPPSSNSKQVKKLLNDCSLFIKLWASGKWEYLLICRYFHVLQWWLIWWFLGSKWC